MTPTEQLKEIIAKGFKGNNEIRFTISPKGNQRIEVEDLDTKEIWQTIEGTIPSDDNSNFDDISEAMINAIDEQMNYK